VKERKGNEGKLREMKEGRQEYRDTGRGGKGGLEGRNWKEGRRKGRERGTYWRVVSMQPFSLRSIAICVWGGWKEGRNFSLQ
jgi:hypothetical protein